MASSFASSLSSNPRGSRSQPRGAQAPRRDGRDRRMRFEALPSVRGDPLSLEMQLIGQADFGPGFFNESSHAWNQRASGRSRTW